MRKLKIYFLLCCLLLQSTFSIKVKQNLEEQEHIQGTIDSEIRGRRDVIEEEKFHNTKTDNSNLNQPTPWIPHPLPPEDPTTKISITNENVKEVLPLYQTTERVTDRPTGRGARASNENWIKLPYPSRDEAQDDILSPPQPSGELINSRMPRINFVTQSKQLDTSESRNDKESVQRPSRTDSIRTDFVRPDEDDRAKFYKPVYPRQAIYYPEESRRFIDGYSGYPGYRGYPEEQYRRDPYSEPRYDRRRVYPGYVPRVDRYDEPYDSYSSRKPKRIIYYAHLPEVVRTPPSVDLRYRFTPDPYRRYEDDYTRTGRYDYRFRNRYPTYPYASLRKEERNYRDLTGAGSVVKDKKEDKVTPTASLPKKEDNFKQNSNSNERNIPVNRNLINSHQYHDGPIITYDDPLSHKSFQDSVRDDGYIRYQEPMFRASIEDPYQMNY